MAQTLSVILGGLSGDITYKPASASQIAQGLAGILSGPTLTVDGSPVETFRVTATAQDAFWAAVDAGQTTVTLPVGKRGRKSTARSLAGRFGSAAQPTQPTRKGRKG